MTILKPTDILYNYCQQGLLQIQQNVKWQVNFDSDCSFTAAAVQIKQSAISNDEVPQSFHQTNGEGGTLIKRMDKLNELQTTHAYFTFFMLPRFHPLLLSLGWHLEKKMKHSFMCIFYVISKLNLIIHKKHGYIFHLKTRHHRYWIKLYTTSQLKLKII